MRRCALAFAAVLLSVTALAGCGSADDEAADASDTASASSDDSSESPDEEPRDDESSDKPDTEKPDDDKDKGDRSGGKGDEPDDTGDDGDNGDNGGREKKSDDSDDAKSANAAYCGMVKRLTSDFDPSNSASLAASRDLDAIADRLDEITQGAPAAVRSSWHRLTTTFEAFGGLVDKYDIDLSDPDAFNKLKPKAQKALATAMQKYQSPQLADATETIKADAMRRCHVKLG